MRSARYVPAILFWAAAAAFGQSAAAKTATSGKEATGGVTGHVLCGDTNLPARFASVLLQPVYEAVPIKSKSSPGGQDEEQQTPAVSISPTMLDGSYTIHGVKPGRYYVMVEKAGYLSPLSQLTREQLNKPDDEAAALISRLLVPVTVTANHVASADVRILRGATVSGTIRFDDGSPDGSGSVSLSRKGKDGKWEAFRNGLTMDIFSKPQADDEGRYVISGLPAGEYLLKTEIAVREVKINNIFGENHGTSVNNGYSLSVYSGGALRTKDAKPIKLQEGETADLADIEIPVSKMHSIRGNVVDASGRPVNAADVALLYADDNTELVSTRVDKDDNAFHFYFVPEGEYTLKVTAAKDVTREEIPFPPGTMPPSYTKEKTVREYADAQQPVSIKGDMTGVVATVKPRT